MPDFLPAGQSDLDELVRTSRLAFDHDIFFGAPGPGGPPGYDSTVWHARALHRGAHLYKICEGGAIIGGIIVHRDEPRRGPGSWVLGRIWLAPEWQGRGVGKAAMAFAEGTVPSARAWRLDTPAWNKRTQHFYESIGYIRIGAVDDMVVYEKPVK